MRHLVRCKPHSTLWFLPPRSIVCKVPCYFLFLSLQSCVPGKSLGLLGTVLDGPLVSGIRTSTLETREREAEKGLADIGEREKRRNVHICVFDGMMFGQVNASCLWFGLGFFFFAAEDESPSDR